MDAGGLGSGPSGRETAPDAKLIQCDEQAVVAVPSLGFSHFFGFLFLGSGLWMSVGGRSQESGKACILTHFCLF